jgi:hypothetical protein
MDEKLTVPAPGTCWANKLKAGHNTSIMKTGNAKKEFIFFMMATI